MNAGRTGVKVSWKKRAKNKTWKGPTGRRETYQAAPRTERPMERPMPRLAHE
jgi:hypothetical protein